MTRFKRKVQVWIYCRHSQEGDFSFLVLLTRPERGSFWQPVTGSVDRGETLIDAALREAQEESGFVFTASPEPVGQPFEYESRGKNVLEQAFLLAVPAPSFRKPSPQLDPHEHIDYRWVTGMEAIQMIAYDSNVQILEIILKQFNISRAGN